MEKIDKACKSLLEDDNSNTGFLDCIFDYRAHISKEDFIKEVKDNHFHFLQPHRIRQMVYSKLISE